VQAITVPSRDSKGLVYRKANRVQGYIAVSEGKAGVYIMPYLHPDVLGYEAAGIIAGVIAQCSRADRMPVYVCVRRYQDWLADSLSRLGFEALAQQAMMVRHIAAGIRQTNFTPLVQKTLEAVPNASPISKTKLRNQEKPST
jgi:secreted trypsin-like serine protease